MAASGGGGKTRRRARDQAMAAALKAAKIERTTCKCPVCYQVVSLNKLYNHISLHK